MDDWKDKKESRKVEERMQRWLDVSKQIVSICTDILNKCTSFVLFEWNLNNLKKAKIIATLKIIFTLSNIIYWNISKKLNKEDTY